MGEALSKEERTWFEAIVKTIQSTPQVKQCHLLLIGESGTLRFLQGDPERFIALLEVEKQLCVRAVIEEQGIEIKKIRKEVSDE